MELALNAQDYTHDAELFEYYLPQVLSRVSPASGPSTGSTSVIVTGLGLWNHTSRFECRFGGSRVPATMLEGGTATRCVTPSAAAAEVESELVVTFGGDAAHLDASVAPYSLLGTAVVEDDGTLTLTANDYHQVGSVSVGAGQVVANSFRVSFDVYVGDGSGGEGFSFCYGRLPTVGAIGASGSQSGLCVRFKTRDASSATSSQTVEASYDGTLLQAFSCGSEEPLRLQAWVPIRITLSAAGLSVEYNEKRLMDHVRVHDWLPEPDWQFVLGASTASWRDVHRVDNLRLHLGAMVDRTSIPLEITANGEQFSISRVLFNYFPTPTVSLVLPEAGPADGGTLVMASGHAPFDAGSHLYCQFNETVVAGTFARTSDVVALGLSNLTGGGVLCRSPALGPGEAKVSLTFNGQDFTHIVGQFYTYAAPRLVSLRPQTGPARGGTRIRIRGANLLAGSNFTRFCRFGHLPVVPAQVDSNSEAICITPSLDPPPTSGEASVFVELTLNEQDFTTDRINFTFYDPPTVTLVSPSTGPTQGGTLLSLRGNFSALGSTYNCSFGTSASLVPATRIAHDILLCSTVALSAGVHSVEVTLNADDYSATSDHAVFRSFLPPALLSIEPASGTRSGGTLVTLTGRGLGAGSHRVCAFNSSLLMPATVQHETRLLCYTPPSHQQELAIGLSLNAQQYLHTSLYFQYYADPVALSLSPTMGPLRGSTVVLIGGRHLHGGSSALCKFGTAPPVVMTPILGSENVTCTTPPRDAGTLAPLALTLNGRQYVDTVLTFAFADDLVVGNLSPASGPIGGSTRVRLRGNGFALGDDLLCRFGHARVHPFVSELHIDHATFDHASGEVRCLTPPAAAGVLPLEITLNGQQFSATSTTLGVYLHPHVSSLSPNSGPIAGGTYFTVHGQFGGGAHYQCHFSGTSEGGTTVPASHSALPDTLRCKSPPGSARLASMVELSPNAQQFSSDTVRFTYYVTLRVSALSPTSGPLEGGTRLEIAGSGFFATPELRCRFANANFAATAPSAFVAHDLASCVMPSTNGTSMRKMLVGPGIPRVTFGTATLLAGGDTLSVMFNGDLEHYKVGTLIMDIHDQLAFSAQAFSMQFDLTTFAGPAMLHSGAVRDGVVMDANLGRGDGWSFSYGDVAQGLVSERGAGLGLRIQVRLFTVNELRVLLGGHLLFARHIFVDPDDNQSVSIRISVQNSELSVQLGNLTVVAHLPLPGWRPQRTWRMAIGSRSGASAARLELRDISVSTSPFADGNALSVEVSANTLDFTTDAVQLSLRPPPTFEVYSPSTGSGGGGIPVSLSGLGMRGGSDYKITFTGSNASAVVGATFAFIDGRDTLSFITPEYATGVANVTVSLNGQQFEAAGQFGFYNQPFLQDISPTSGPVGGGTLVRLWGSVFAGGSVYRCRFGAALVTADFDPALNRELACRLPEGLSLGVHVLEVTINGQEFTDSHLNFTVYGNSTVTFLCPNSGPIVGGTAVRVVGALLANGSHYLCRFAGVVVNASYVEGAIPHEVRCTAPTMAQGALVPVELSLNGQNFTSSEAIFTYHSPAVLTELCPSTGPAYGGTSLLIVGIDLGLGSDYRVAIRDDHNETVLPVVYQPQTASVQFITPSLSIGTQRLRVGLNAQQFTYA